MKGFLIVALVGLTATFITADPDCSKYPDGVALPNPGNCEHFFVCNAHTAVPKKCPVGLHFSPYDLYCLPRGEAHCDGSNPGPGPGPGPTSDPGPGPGPGPKPDPNSCHGQDLGKNVPFPNDCTKYITCIGGGVTRNCPPNTHFNKEKEVCDWIERAGCK